jgi:hypothetical protein
MKRQRTDPANFDLSTPCQLCGYKIQPNELLRTGWSSIRCPQCLKEFEPVTRPCQSTS